MTDEKKMERRVTDKKYGGVRRNYVRRAEILDTMCHDNCNTHLFANAIKISQSGSVHPILFRAFGDTDRAIARIIKKCAKMAAARAENSNVTPLSDNGNRGTMFHVIHAHTVPAGDMSYGC